MREGKEKYTAESKYPAHFSKEKEHSVCTLRCMYNLYWKTLLKTSKETHRLCFRLALIFKFSFQCLYDFGLFRTQLIVSFIILEKAYCERYVELL